MNWRYPILVLVSVALIPSGLLGAEGTESVEQPQCPDSDLMDGDLILPALDGPDRADYEPIFLTRGQNSYYGGLAARFGWWGVTTQGNTNKIGEWQGLTSSAFFDLDGLTSDGTRTLDFHVTGPESAESTDFGLSYFGPYVSADVDYQRFMHRLDHDPLTYFDDTDSDGSYIGGLTDLNAGEDYAIRVQKLDARFKGNLTENVKWRLDLWGMHKRGTRQVQAFSHWCSNRQCHIQTQRQNIDWLTLEIKPAIEVNLGPVTAEYSRTMRSFDQSDSLVTRSYGGRPVNFADPSLQYPYAVVPNNFTQIDRLKIGADLTENTQLYANLFVGDTENKTRGVHRDFNGADLRVTNRSIDGLSVTGFAKWYEEKGQLPPTFPEDPLYNAGHLPSEEVRAPVDRERIKAGVKGRYKFNQSYQSEGLALTGGYEYSSIDRTNVTYFLTDPFNGWDRFRQPTTVSNMMHVGTQYRFSAAADAFVRYKMISTQNPLFGFSEAQEGNVLGDAINTKQAENVDLIEFGGTWTPTYNFLLSSTIGLQKRRTTREEGWAHFEEDDYPIMVSAWYAPTPCFSVSGGLAFYSNWIDQDITVGKGHPIRGGGPEPVDNMRFAYGGRATVVTLGSRYAATERVTLRGDVEFVDSRNGFLEPISPSGADYQFLPGASDVVTETTRISAGVDYWLRDGISCYFVYNYYNWNDLAGNNESGSASMFLGGLTATY